MRYNSDKNYRAWINTTRWRQLRARALRKHPCCVQCEVDGYVTAATEVHHRVPVESGAGVTEQERLMFDPDNLMPLCHRCHVLLHERLGKGTRAETERRQRDTVAGIIKFFFDG